VLYAFSHCLFTFQMFQFVINVRSTRHTWTPVLQRCFSAVALSDHKKVRTMKCQNGEKVRNYLKFMKVTLFSTAERKTVLRSFLCIPFPAAGSGNYVNCDCWKEREL